MRTKQPVSQSRRVAALEENNDKENHTIDCTRPDNDFENHFLPGLGEDAKEEETESDFQKCRGQDVEDFAQLDKRHGHTKGFPVEVLGLSDAK